MSRSARVARNVSWSLVAQAFVAAANLLLIPRIVHGFGEEAYGLYVLMFAAANYVQLLSFGAGAATVNFVAERHAAHDGRGASQALRYGAALHMGGATVGAAALWAAAPWAVSVFFRVPAPLWVPGVAILRAAAVGAVFAAGVVWTQTGLQGLQRFDWNGVSTALQGAMMPLGIVVLLRFGKGLRAAGFWYIAVSALSLAVSALILRHALSREPKRGAGAGLPFKTFFSYGFGMWAGSIAWIVANQFDKLFVARSLALASLTLYAVPVGLLQRLQVIPASVSSVLLPVITGARGEGALDDVSKMYCRSTRLLAAFMAPAYILLFALMPQFLSLWLGGRFGAEGVWPARLLVVAHAFGVLVYTMNPVAASHGRVWWLTANAWGQALLSLVLWPVLIPRFGIVGAAGGTMAAQALPIVFTLGVVHRLLRLSWREYAWRALGPALTGGAVLLALLLPVHQLAGSWAGMTALSGAGCAVYALTAWLCLPDLDRDFLRRWRPWRAI
jgi:O-antigen/teichoic acid export membrane protein